MARSKKINGGIQEQSDVNISNDEKYARFDTRWFNETMTRERNKQCTNALKVLKRHPSAVPFLKPVDPIKLNIPDYPVIVKTPMDFSTVEKKLNNYEYKCAHDFEKDVRLIFSNCIIYNGQHHQFSKYAKDLEEIFIEQLSKIPGAKTTTDKAAREIKQEKPAPKPVAESSTKPISKQNLKPTTEATSSSIVKTENSETNRPKRKIKFPNKELPQITQPSRRKRTKKNIDLKFCRLVYQELKKRQHFTYAYPFYEPVNAEKLGVPEYYNVIKNPMDLSKVYSRLESEDYASAEEFEADIRLMFDNCYKFNAPGTDVYNMGKQLENVFDKKWTERPIPQPHSAAREKIKEEEESASDKESEQAKHLKALQKHLAALSSQLNQYRKSGKSKTKKPATKKTAKKATKSKLKSDADTSTDSIPKAKRRRTSKDDIDAFVNENDDKELSADQKAFLSKRIEYLPQELMVTLIGIIQQSGATLMPEEGGYELEIESIDTKTAKRIYNFVMANTSEPNGRKQRKTPVKRKVQMSEEEQIKALEETLAKFDNKSTSPNKANDSSDDDSSDSQSSASSGSEPSDSDTANQNEQNKLKNIDSTYDTPDRSYFHLSVYKPDSIN
nr:979_t:CDS:2 [Entrophospora candida]